MNNVKFFTLFYTLLISFILIKKNVKCAREPPTVEIPGQGVASGKISVGRTRSTVFLGIPFAEPPINNLRFAPPDTKLTPWSGIRNASEYGPACLQNREQLLANDRLFSKLMPDLQFSEDCLYLNIYLPDGTKPAEGWPVLLWFHPGNFSVGAPHFWDGSTFAIKQKVIVVTSAYRLNLFGFFTTADYVAPGNSGLLDQVAALEWVQSKISVFGGDPDSTVICGHSAGGTSAGLHMVSQLSHGKFSRVIAMSSKGFITQTIKSPYRINNFVKEMADIFNCETKSSKLLECLRKIDGEELIERAYSLIDSFGPIVDRDFANDSRAFLTDDPKQLVLAQQYAKVPLLVGYTDMEEALEIIEANQNWMNGISWDDFNQEIAISVATDMIDYLGNETCLEDFAVNHLSDTVLFYYTPRPLADDLTILRGKYIDLTTEKFYASGPYFLASALAQSNVNTYVYRFDYRLKTDNFIRFPFDEAHLPSWITAPHQFDLLFVWGVPYWTHLKKNVTWNSADKKMSDTMMNLWGNFIKYGNPTHSGLHLKWDVFKDNTSGVMILDRNSNMSDINSFDYKSFQFWNKYYPNVWDVLLKSCNMTSGTYDNKVISKYYWIIFILLHTFYILLTM